MNTRVIFRWQTPSRRSGFSFFNRDKQTNTHGYHTHEFIFPPTTLAQHYKRFTLSQPKKIGSISQKSTHPIRTLKMAPAHGQVATWMPYTLAENRT